jgi:hypothetical protein
MSPRGPDQGGTEKSPDGNDWVEVPKDPEWQEDIDEHNIIYSGPGNEIKTSTTLKPTSFGSLLQEFCLKVIHTSSHAYGVTRRRAGGNRAGY